MKLFFCRFPDQGEQAGGVVVLADTLEEAKERLTKNFNDLQEGREWWDWQKYVLENLDENFGEDGVYTLFCS